MFLFKASAKVEATFKDKNVEFKLVCFGTEQDVSQTFVAGEGIGIFETSSDLVEALVDLIAAYYVFDVNYADNMSGMLFFLQDEVLINKVCSSPNDDDTSPIPLFRERLI